MQKDSIGVFSLPPFSPVVKAKGEFSAAQPEDPPQKIRSPSALLLPSPRALTGTDVFITFVPHPAASAIILPPTSQTSLPSRSSFILPLWFDVTKLQEGSLNATHIWEATLYLCAAEAFKSISYVPYVVLRLYLLELLIGFSGVYHKLFALTYTRGATTPFWPIKEYCRYQSLPSHKERSLLLRSHRTAFPKMSGSSRWLGSFRFIAYDWKISLCTM